MNTSFCPILRHVKEILKSIYNFQIHIAMSKNNPESELAKDKWPPPLQSESPALEKEYKPSDRYYFLIAKSLHITGYFRSQFPEDWELKSKVEYWHSLIKKQEKNL